MIFVSGNSPNQQPEGNGDDGRRMRILLVDPAVSLRAAVAAYFRQTGARVVSASNAWEALARLSEDAFDLVLVDASQPTSSISAFRREVKERWPELRVAGMAGSPTPEVLLANLLEDPDHYTLKPFHLEELGAAAVEVTETNRLGKADVDTLLSQDEEFSWAVLRAVRSLVQAVEAKDAYTRGHSLRVSEYAVILGEALGGFDVQRLRLGGELHDVGKIGVPDRVLNKPGRLDPEEFDQIKRHPGMGRRILEPLINDEQILSMTLYHHERWDGRGYPKGLQGEAIPVVARVLGVADALDAITSSRAYRAAGSWDYAMARITSQAGTQFDPQMVEALRSAMPRLHARHDELRGRRLAVG